MRTLALLGFSILIHALAGLPILLAVVYEFPYNTNSNYVSWMTLMDAYAHVVLFVPVLCVISVTALTVALRELFLNSYQAQAILIIVIGIISGAVFAWVDSSADHMLLLELAPSAHSNAGRACALNAVTETPASLSECQEFGPESLAASSNLNESESVTRIWYLVSIAYAISLLVVTFLLSIFLSSRVKSARGLANALWPTCISAVVFICWLPFRTRYNNEVKSPLFGDEAIMPIIGNWNSGLGMLELAGILLLIVVLLVLIWKFSETFDKASELITKVLTLLTAIGVSGLALGQIRLSSWIDYLVSSQQALSIWALVCFILAVSIPLSVPSTKPSVGNEERT